MASPSPASTAVFARICPGAKHDQITSRSKTWHTFGRRRGPREGRRAPPSYHEKGAEHRRRGSWDSLHLPFPFPRTSWTGQNKILPLAPAPHSRERGEGCRRNAAARQIWGNTGQQGLHRPRTARHPASCARPSLHTSAACHGPPPPSQRASPRPRARGTAPQASAQSHPLAAPRPRA